MSVVSVAPDPDRLSRLLGLAYEAPMSFGSDNARDKEAWRRFADEAAEALGCQLAMVEYYDPGNPQRSFIAAGGLHGFEEAFCSARARGQEDNYLRNMLNKPQGTVLLGAEIVNVAEMRRSRCYSSLALPWQLEHFLMATVLAENGGSAFFSLGRAAREAPFVEVDKAVISRLVLAHLTRSMRMQRELAAACGSNALLSAAVQQAPTGIVAFNWQGKLVMSNQKASTIFAMDDGLTLVDGELHAEAPAVHAQLDQALAAMLQIAQGLPVPPPAPVPVPRRSTRHPYKVTFSTLATPGNSADFPSGSAIVAVVHDERRANGPSIPAALRTAYGLTRAEVRLCQGMLEGQSLAEAATRLGVSRNTAKTHLARVFDKTGVRSQVALLRLLTIGTRG